MLGDLLGSQSTLFVDSSHLPGGVHPILFVANSKQAGDSAPVCFVAGRDRHRDAMRIVRADPAVLQGVWKQGPVGWSLDYRVLRNSQDLKAFTLFTLQ